MTIAGATARPQLATDDQRSGIERPARQQLASVAWFAGLSLALALIAFAAGRRQRCCRSSSPSGPS